MSRTSSFTSPKKNTMTSKSEAVERAEIYYDSTEADAFYKTIWGTQMEVAISQL